jgi:hypothetical protein
MVLPSVNPELGRGKQQDHEFKASPGYIVRTCLKNKQKKNAVQMVPNL